MGLVMGLMVVPSWYQWCAFAAIFRANPLKLTSLKDIVDLVESICLLYVVVTDNR